MNPTVISTLIICITIVIVALLIIAAYVYCYVLDNNCSNRCTSVPRDEIRRLQEQCNDLYKMFQELKQEN